MKRLVSPRRLRVALPLLAMAVLLTVPSTATASKYVWQDTIDVELHVVYGNTIITSLLPEGHPSEFWVQDLTNIGAAATAEGLVLTPAEGYTLPETITVKIGQQTFSVRTDGTQNPEGITFQPETGLLSIEQSLLDENPGGVTVSAAAVKVEIPVEGAPPDESTPLAEDAAPTESTASVEDTLPTEGTPPAEDAVLTEGAPPVEDTPSTEGTPPAGDAAPTESTAPVEDTLPAEGTPSAEDVTPPIAPRPLGTRRPPKALCLPGTPLPPRARLPLRIRPPRKALSPPRKQRLSQTHHPPEMRPPRKVDLVPGRKVHTRSLWGALQKRWRPYRS